MLMPASAADTHASHFRHAAALLPLLLPLLIISRAGARPMPPRPLMLMLLLIRRFSPVDASAPFDALIFYDISMLLMLMRATLSPPC